MKKISSLREAIRKSTVSEVTRLEKEYNIDITDAAKRYLRQTATAVFKTNSPDIERAGEVVIKRHSGGRESAYLIENNDSVRQIKKSIQIVVDLAAQNATTRSVTVKDIDVAISARWCGIFPFCCTRTSKKLSLPIGDYNGNAD
jgi:hypothetical protein